MCDNPRLPNAAQLLHDLQNSKELRHQAAPPIALDPALALLRRWQSERLTRTYADLLAEKTYRLACQFFLSEIYAPCDFSQRNQDISQIHAFLSRAVPPQMLQTLTDAIELNRLTDLLDSQLVHILIDQLGVTETITPTVYAEGYHLCDNYAQRVHQIELITKLIRQVGESARLPVVGLALKILRGPAHRAGWDELYGFLVRGYDAFKQIRTVSDFVEIIEQREKQILDEIFIGKAHSLQPITPEIST
jgi:hypothetical protein